MFVGFQICRSIILAETNENLISDINNTSGSLWQQRTIFQTALQNSKLVFYRRILPKEGTS
jgi:hypothetical protein